MGTYVHNGRYGLIVRMMSPHPCPTDVSDRAPAPVAGRSLQATIDDPHPAPRVVRGRLVSVQRVFLDGRTLPFACEMGRIGTQ